MREAGWNAHLAGELVATLLEGEGDGTNDRRRRRYAAGAQLVGKALQRMIRGDG